MAITKQQKRIIKYFVTHNSANTTKEEWRRFFDKYTLSIILKSHSILTNHFKKGKI